MFICPLNHIIKLDFGVHLSCGDTNRIYRRSAEANAQNCICSTTHSVQWHAWRIWCEPEPLANHSACHIASFLRCCSGSAALCLWECFGYIFSEIPTKVLMLRVREESKQRYCCESWPPNLCAARFASEVPNVSGPISHLRVVAFRPPTEVNICTSSGSQGIRTHMRIEIAYTRETSLFSKHSLGLCHIYFLDRVGPLIRMPSPKLRIGFRLKKWARGAHWRRVQSRVPDNVCP